MSCLVEMDHVSYAYPDGQKALNDLSLHIKHGERVGLVGPNGAGKTTLFMLLSGVVDNFTGTISVAGDDLSTSDGRKSVHRKLGVVFQNTDDQLFNATVLDDIAFGPLNMGLDPKTVYSRIENAMQQVGLSLDFKDRLPFHLSGGEKRRVALAGVLAMKPQILLLDEPSSDLDPRGRRELQTILNDLPITRIVSSHNLEFVLNTCDRVVIVDGGTIVCDGPIREVLSNHEVMIQHGLEVPFSLL